MHGNGQIHPQIDVDHNWKGEGGGVKLQLF